MSHRVFKLNKAQSQKSAEKNDNKREGHVFTQEKNWHRGVE